MALKDRIAEGQSRYERAAEAKAAKNEEIKQYNKDRMNSDVVTDIHGDVLSDEQLGADLFGVSSEDAFETMNDGVDAPTRSKKKKKTSFDFATFDKAVESIKEARAEEGDEDDELDISKLSRSERKALREAMGGSIEAYPHLMALRPYEYYIFHSDYYRVDDEYACIMAFFHDDEASDDFATFWGVDRIPNNLGPGVSTVLMEQVVRMNDRWVDDNLQNADKLDKLEEREQDEGGTRSTKRRAVKVANDMSYIVAELQSGASYLSVHNRLWVKAPSLEQLDAAVEKIERLYIDRFHTLRVAPFHGEQRQEMSTMFSFNNRKRGKGFHYTSTEYAGSYSLVTNGMNDPTGEYVGFLYGDVNNSAIFFDVDNWDDHIVGADNALNRRLGRTLYSDMWASKVSQAALCNDHRVVHLVLNGADLDRLGPPLESMTARVDMTNGEINMFELFGDPEDELALYQIHIRKLTLMVEQAYGAKENDAALPIIRGQLSEILTDFYTDLRMWAYDADKHRDELRLVGLDHSEVPLLQVFSTYLDTRYEAIKRSEAKDPDVLNAVSVLRTVIKSMLDNNGVLFNQHTSDMIDGVDSARRVIYDFSGLTERGNGIAMAQLVNVIGFAVSTLEEGDVVLVHGAEQIVDGQVQEYLTQQFDVLRNRIGARIGLFYNSVESMLQNQWFNQFTTADYTLLGSMNNDEVVNYQDQMRQSIPPALQMVVTTRQPGMTYLRRGAKNVVFMTDIALGINPERDERGHRIKRRAATIEDDSARASNRGGGVTDTSTVAAENELFSKRTDKEHADIERRVSATGVLAAAAAKSSGSKSSTESELVTPESKAVPTSSSSSRARTRQPSRSWEEFRR